MTRERLLVEPEIQIRLIIILISAVTLEGFFIGWGVFRLVRLASEWGRPNLIWDFFKWAMPGLVLIIGINYLLGLYLSHRIAGPLHRLRHALRSLRKGELEPPFQVRSQDILKDFTQELNETTSWLHSLVTRDREFVLKALSLLGECEKSLNGKGELTAERRKILQNNLNEARSHLVLVNAHFVKPKEPA